MTPRARPRLTYQCMRCRKKVVRTEEIPGALRRHAAAACPGRGELVLVGYAPADDMSSPEQCKNVDEPGRN